jgi:hypothetical protein
MGFFIGLFRTFFKSRDIGTLPGDFQHDGRADTAMVGGDDGDFAFEIHHFLPG